MGTASRAAAGEGSTQPHGPTKYWHYLFVVSALAIVVSSLALVNAYLRLDNTSSYSVAETGVPSSILLAGYLGMFFSILVLPVPDYILVPVYGFLCTLGLFDPVPTFLVCLAASVLPVEYVCGRFLARPIVRKILPLFLMSERELVVADRWLEEHGRFSVFISTFIPFFFSAVALVAGTLRMGAVAFLVWCAVGFGLRYAFLEYVGYHSVYIFTSSFDYSQRDLFLSVLALSAAYAGAHLLRAWSGRRARSAARVPHSKLR